MLLMFFRGDPRPRPACVLTFYNVRQTPPPQVTGGLIGASILQLGGNRTAPTMAIFAFRR